MTNSVTLTPPLTRKQWFMSLNGGKCGQPWYYTTQEDAVYGPLKITRDPTRRCIEKPHELTRDDIKKPHTRWITRWRRCCIEIMCDLTRGVMVVVGAAYWLSWALYLKYLNTPATSSFLLPLSHCNHKRWLHSHSTLRSLCTHTSHILFLTSSAVILR